MYQNEGFIGSGDLHLDVFSVLGVKTGELFVGNASAFAINAPSIEKKEQKGMMRENFAQTTKSVITKLEQELKFTLTDINRENLVLAMYGQGTTVSQTAGTGTETLSAIHDRWVKMGHRKLDPATPPVVTVATVAQTEGEDYEIDYQVGRIKVLSTGGIADAAPMSIESHWLAMAGYQVAGQKVNKIEAYIRLIGRDVANARDCEVIVHKCQLEPSGDINWLTEDYVTLEFKGKILATPDGSWDVIVY